MEKFTTNEEKELCKAGKKLEKKLQKEVEERGEQVVKYWKRKQEEEKGNKKGEKKSKLEKEEEREAELEAIKIGGQVLELWRRQKKAERNAAPIYTNIHQSTPIQGASQLVDRVLREDEDIYPFDNRFGENNCWLKSVL